MTAPSEQLEYQGQVLQQLVAGVKADQWDNPTPCAKWSVKDLVGHVVGGGTMFAASFRGDTPQEGDPSDLLGDDPAGAVAKVFADFASAADSDGAMDRDIVLPFATLPAQVALDVAKFDLLVHAWDLAHSTGQSFDPPAEVVEN
ncbi:MAG TPA: TIGR03086 family metal-binding protein, partial [Acidimicrobiia bacterium]|nr:TIGR03086 family metal-binding protein [Acidimicrobiia bacterium]